MLVDQGLLEGSLRVPNAISPIELIVDLKSGRVTCEAALPDTSKIASSGVGWLVPVMLSPTCHPQPDRESI